MDVKTASIQDQVSAQEWETRVNLAAAYRLVALYGWDDLVFTHISARVPGSDHHFLINPYGFMFEEITASSLVKIDINGKKMMDSPYDINPAGFTIHSCIHSAREDAQCVMHVHSLNGVAVSAQKNGLLPISQQSLFVLSSLAYHDYEGVVIGQRRQHEQRLLRNRQQSLFVLSSLAYHDAFVVVIGQRRQHEQRLLRNRQQSLFVLSSLAYHDYEGVVIGQRRQHEQRLLPISQQSLFVLSSLAYHDYEGVVIGQRRQHEQRLLPISQQSLFVLSSLAYHDAFVVVIGQRRQHEQRLLRNRQQSLFVLSSLAYHDYEGVALNPDEKPRLVRDLGDKNFLMLRNHGLLTLGASPADAFLFMYLFEAACMIQVRAQSGGGELIPIAQPILDGIQKAAKMVTRGLGGALAWPGLLRKLDRMDASFRD